MTPTPSPLLDLSETTLLERFSSFSVPTTQINESIRWKSCQSEIDKSTSYAFFLSRTCRAVMLRSPVFLFNLIFFNFNIILNLL